MAKTRSRVTNTLRARRFAHGEITQAELARQIGVTRQTIIAIEQGKFSPTLESALRLERVFGVPVSEIFKLLEDLEEE
ncbi:MAG: helix-turn-helix transcriptional regulator [Proteobacteria bacterium]|nr:helix-turn-helix transcriptional regulator [Pseudomonadota bacterium]